MYHTHWGLQTSPFSGVNHAPANASASPMFDEALARLQYLVDQRGRVGLLIGPAGTGKTTVLRRFCEVSRRRGLNAALVGGQGCDERSLFNQLLRGWQLPTGSDGDQAVAWELISDRLAELHYEQTAAIIALDNADQATVAVRLQLERLLHLATACQAQLTLLLGCTTESAGALGRGLLEQVELRIDLNTWSEGETAEHVAQRLYHSGSEQPIFTDDAITALHELAGGIPRKVDQIAQLALLAGAGQQLREIDAMTLAEAYEELGIGGL